MDRRPRIRVAVFEGFELLDVFGPLEFLGSLAARLDASIVAPHRGLVRSAQSTAAAITHVADPGDPCDVLLVPGGPGTRHLVRDPAFLAWLTAQAASSRVLASVCTGAALLAAARLLDGYRATTNKRAFEWVRSVAPQVSWVAQARWVRDRDRWTSSGVSAGMDMTLALIADLLDPAAAEEAAAHAEYDWHRDPSWDPFASVPAASRGRLSGPAARPGDSARAQR